jgi:hypothetical protein
MPEIEMPPQYAGQYSDPHDTEGHVSAAVQNLAGLRVDQWVTFVMTAVSDFETNANAHIDSLEYDHDATYDFNPVLVSYAAALVNAFPPTKMASSIVSSVMSPLQNSYQENLTSGLTGAKARLRDSLVALVGAARKSGTVASSEIQTKLPEAVDDAMTWVDSASTDAGYVSALCDWMGFPQPTLENTVVPVRQALENLFFGVYQAVRAQLLRTQNVAGLDDDDLDPVAWQREAIQSQAGLFRQDGSDAWKKAYEEGTGWSPAPR